MSMQAFVRRPPDGVPLASAAQPRDPGLAQEFHHWPLPAYVWPALEQRYHSIFCSEPHLRIHDGLSEQIGAWVSRESGCIQSVLLYERLGSLARLLNEVFSPAPADLARFTDAAFMHHPELDAVLVHAAAIDGKVPGYWNLAAPVSEDFVLALPTDAGEWMASLSAQTREKLRYHLRRTCRKQPSFTFRTLEAGEIREAQLRTVIDFNRARMEKKGRRFGLGTQEERGLLALMRERGRLHLIEIDGQVRAGLLCTLAGDDIYMHVIAHDPAFDDLRLGLLCCRLAVEDAIARGLRRFHFLWGHYDYKTRLGGRPVVLRRVLLLRSPLSAFRHPRLVAAQLRLNLRARLRAALQRWRQQRMPAKGERGGHVH